eukprot:CAMPEP_0173456290 /NCGR_PEP_ID=MMETSP1357-20121228/55751_1 /TAXON_ID=77926 /ORGANISM="Hemiselmis rufescens, Strain PCC563" /LENGTH=122 /DNA_ID=CAMNT_0014423491 /DNA_START=15 /DNA_END=379 /DNA_ORIENTATION=+
MCRPANVASQITKEESFDSADMEEEDEHEGVGVDERVSSLTPDDFLLEDDQPWHSSARWVLSPDDSATFVAAALVTHLAPIYVPFAPNTATQPSEIVPPDVQADARAFAEEFVRDSRLHAMS